MSSLCVYRVSWNLLVGKELCYILIYPYYIILKKMSEQENTSNTENAKPAKSFRAGAVEVSVWKRKIKMPDGQEKSFYNIKTDRQYKDKEGNWHSTNTMDTQEIPKLVLALQKAYEFIVLKERG